MYEVTYDYYSVGGKKKKRNLELLVVMGAQEHREAGVDVNLIK